MSLVSCRHRTSGRRSSSHGSSRGTRCLTEFTFQVTIRTPLTVPSMVVRRFDSLYSHGFARIAAAVPHVRPAEPVFNAERTLELARQASDAPRGGRGLPGARALGLRDRRPAAPAGADRRGARRAGDAGRGERVAVPRARRRRPAARRGRAVQLRGRHPPRARPRRRAQELPARVPRVLRGAPVPRRARADRHDDPAAGRGRAGGQRPALRRLATSPAWSCTRRSARTSGRRCRRARSARWRARRCC